MPRIVLYIAIFVLVVGVAPLPYGYYTLLRIVATGVFAWAALISFERDEKVLPWVFAFGVILFNPLFPIYLSKEIWMVIDLGAAALLFFTRGRFVEVDAVSPR